MHTTRCYLNKQDRYLVGNSQSHPFYSHNNSLPLYNQSVKDIFGMGYTHSIINMFCALFSEEWYNRDYQSAFSYYTTSIRPRIMSKPFREKWYQTSANYKIRCMCQSVLTFIVSLSRKKYRKNTYANVLMPIKKLQDGHTHITALRVQEFCITTFERRFFQFWFAKIEHMAKRESPVAVIKGQDNYTKCLKIISHIINVPGS